MITILAEAAAGGPEQLSPLTNVLVGAGTGGVVVAFLSFLLKWRKGSQFTLQDLNDRIGKRLTAVENDVRQCEKKHAECEAKHTDCEHKVSRLQGEIEEVRRKSARRATSTIIVDHHGKIVEAGPNAVAMFRRKREDLIGECADVLLPESTRPKHRRRFIEFAAQGTDIPKRPTTLVARRGDGSHVLVEVCLEDSYKDHESGQWVFIAEVREMRGPDGGSVER